MPSDPWTMSAGKQSVQTWNSVTCPAGVMRPTFFAAAFGLLMNDSVNQKLPSLARVMCSGVLPVVGTLNCLSLSDGAADADVAMVAAATTVATTIASRLRPRRVIVHSRGRVASNSRGDDERFDAFAVLGCA